MNVLGIETSCDETSAAVVRDGNILLSCVVSSSLKFHAKYGGIIPEIASRMQLETITQVTDSAMKEAGLKLKNIGLVSVTCAPGLPGSLLVGISFAKAVSASFGIPLLGIDHVQSHLYANFLSYKKNNPSASLGLLRIDTEPLSSGECIKLPFVGLVVSGGHTSLFYVRDFKDIELLGQTRDDACGEAFDKVAKIMGLSYPGGPLIEKLAAKGDPRGIKFRCSNTANPMDFSFSGIKTAVLYYLRGSRNKTGPVLAQVAASFQETVIDTLIQKSFLACEKKETDRLVLGGGVIANNRLRERFFKEAKGKGVRVFFPPRQFCIDNAAMVAGLGYRLFRAGTRSSLGLSAGLN